jgi:hypothetical protein
MLTLLKKDNRHTSFSLCGMSLLLFCFIVFVTKRHSAHEVWLIKVAEVATSLDALHFVQEVQ